MRKLVDWYQKIAVLLLNTAVLLIIANVVLGVVFALRDRDEPDEKVGVLDLYDPAVVRTAYPDQPWADVVAMLSETWGRPFQCDPFLGFRESPYTGEYVHVHPVGFRWGAEEPPWPPREDTLNVFVFGGSTTFGYGVADAHTLPAQMQTALAARFPDQPVQVYNFGQGAFYSTQERMFFEQLLLEGFRPDIAVFVDGLNDANAELHDITVAGHYSCGQSGTGSVDADALTVHLPIIRAARAVRARLGDDQAAQDTVQMFPGVYTDLEALYAAETPRKLARWQANRALIRAAAQQFGVDTVFVWQPVPDYHLDPACHPFYSSSPTSKVGLLYQAFAAESATWQTWDDFLFLADVQLNRCEMLYVDGYHFTGAFNAELARDIVDFMAQRHLLAG